jgi:hypothetical protein
MRAWRLSDGRRLVEEGEGLFVLRTSDGRTAGFFKSGQTSDREYLYTSEYAVVGSELRCRFTADNTDSDRPAKVTDAVELAGLTLEA